MAEKMLPIRDVAARFGIDEAELYYYGPYKAKLEPSLARRLWRLRPLGEPGPPGAGDGHHPHAGRRGQDHHGDRPVDGPEPPAG